MAKAKAKKKTGEHLLGSGMAKKAAKKIKGRRAQLDALIDGPKPKKKRKAKPTKVKKK